MNIFNAPLPGTTLRTITEEWKVFSGFHALMRQRMKLEAEHLSQLRRLQDSIDPNWPNSGVWTLISPVFQLWSSQIDIMEECNRVLIKIVEACPRVPSPDEPEKGVIPSSRYVALHGPYKVYQDCQTAASTGEAIAEMQKWYKRNCDSDGYVDKLEVLPAIDRNYRESVVAQRDTLQPIAEWHSTRLSEKLEDHVRYAEVTKTCVGDYLVKYSKFSSNFIKSISMAQKRLAEFSSLALIDPSQKCFESESLHPALRPAAYLNYWLGGVPAEPVLGVMSHLPKLLEMGDSRGSSSKWFSVDDFLQVEKESTSVNEVSQKFRDRFSVVKWHITPFVLRAIGPLLPISEDAIYRCKNGIKREEISLLLKPFPIEHCRMAFTVIASVYKWYSDGLIAERIFGSSDTKQLLWDIWRKWDFDNHCPLPREVVRGTRDGELVYKKTGILYEPPQQ